MGTRGKSDHVELFGLADACNLVPRRMSARRQSETPTHVRDEGRGGLAKTLRILVKGAFVTATCLQVPLKKYAVLALTHPNDSCL